MNPDEDWIEDQLLKLKLDIKYSIRDEAHSSCKKDNEEVINEVLNQMEISFAEASQKTYLDFPILQMQFKELLIDFYERTEQNYLR